MNKWRQCIFADIDSEREKQLDQWGDQRHSSHTWVTILVEEIGEAAQAALKGQLENWRLEMIQIAAVAVAALEDFDRNTEDDEN
jgi:NTP pyrophosphatase (non-canonical NTP hydrolase)